MNLPRRLSVQDTARAMELICSGITDVNVADSLGVQAKTLRRTLTYAERYGYWKTGAPEPSPSLAQVQRIAARRLGINGQ
jgi:hypothetical protein